MYNSIDKELTTHRSNESDLAMYNSIDSELKIYNSIEKELTDDFLVDLCQNNKCVHQQDTAVAMNLLQDLPGVVNSYLGKQLPIDLPQIIKTV